MSRKHCWGGYNRAVALTDSVIVTRFLQGQARQIPAKTEEDGQKTQPLVEDLLAFDSFWEEESPFFLNNVISGCQDHTLRQAPFPRVVGQHKLHSVRKNLE